MLSEEKHIDRPQLLKDLTEVVIASVTDNPLGVIVSKIAEKSIDWYFQQENDTENHLRNALKNRIPGPEQQYIPMIEAAVLICSKNWNPISQEHNAQKAARRLSAEFIEKYNSHYSESEIAILEHYLEGFLREMILGLALKLESDASFQVAWKDKIEARLNMVVNSSTCNDICTIGDVSESTDYYRSIWTEKMFLDRNEENGKQLCECYVLPSCIERRHLLELQNQYKSKAQLERQIEKEAKPFSDSIREFLSSSANMMVLFGQPGAGKSAAITWLLNQPDLTAGFSIRAYRLADFETVEWFARPNNIPVQIIKALGLPEAELEDSILVLDGLDEVAMGDGYTALLNSLYNWKKIRNFRLIVTCRTMRIDSFDYLKPKCLVLCSFSEKEILLFSERCGCHDKIEGLKTLFGRKHEMKEILGIPFLLYMFLKRNVTVSSSTSLARIYNAIFLPESEDNIQVRNKYDEKHMVTAPNKTLIYRFSKRAATTMWAYRPQKAYITKEECSHILEELGMSTDANLLHDLLIGQYFSQEKSAEQGEVIRFIHRSIYEYYVALSFYDCILAMEKYGSAEKLIDAAAVDCAAKFLGITNRRIKQPLTDFGRLLVQNNLTDFPEIRRFLKLLLESHGKEKLERSLSWWKSFFNQTTDGKIDFIFFASQSSDNRITFKKRIALCNLLSLLIIISDSSGISAPYEVIKHGCVPLSLYTNFHNSDHPDGQHEQSIVTCNLNFSRMKLKNFALPCCDLYHSDLSGAHLNGSDLSGANLEGSQLNKAVLVDVNFTGANLSGAVLSGAQLDKAIWTNANLTGADLSGIDLTGTNMTGATLTGAYFVESVLSEVDWENAVMGSCNFTRCQMAGADFFQADLSHSIFSYANMKGANLSWTDLGDVQMIKTVLDNADLRGSNLSRASLSNASFTGAKLSWANMKRSVMDKTILREADLVGANLSGASLPGADLTEAHLHQANLTDAMLANADLSGAYLDYADFTNADLHGAILNDVKMSSFKYQNKCYKAEQFPNIFAAQYKSFSLHKQTVKDRKSSFK